MRATGDPYNKHARYHTRQTGGRQRVYRKGPIGFEQRAQTARLMGEHNADFWF